jgi:hypothetical protein
MPVEVLRHCAALPEPSPNPTMSSIRSWRTVVESYVAIFIDDNMFRWFFYKAGVETDNFTFDFLHGIAVRSRVEALCS